MSKPNLDDHLSCSICCEPYDLKKRTPKLLTRCFHTFCESCLTNLIDQNNTIKCPSCRQVSNLSEKGHGLAANFALFEILQVKYGSESQELEVKTEKKEVNCDGCEEEHPALYHCMECDENFCEQLYKAHIKMKLSRNHKLTPIDEMKSQTREKSNSSITTSKCPKHPEDPVRYYCKDENVMFCMKCYPEFHNGHNDLAIEEAFEMEKKDLLPLLKQADLRSKEMENNLADAQETKMQLQDIEAELVTEVCEYFSQIRVTLNRREHELLTSVERTCYSKIKKIDREIDEIAMNKISLLNGAEQIKKILDRRNYAHVFAMKSGFKQSVQRLIQTPLTDLREYKTKISFLADPDATWVANMLTHAGSIFDEITKPEKCTAFGEGLVRASPEYQTSFTIVSRDGKGTQRTSGGDDFDVEIKGDFPEEVEATVTDLRDGQYSVGYLLPEDSEGELQIAVKLNGIHISGSPFLLRVDRLIHKSMKCHDSLRVNANIITGSGKGFKSVVGKLGWNEGIHSYGFKVRSIVPSTNRGPGIICGFVAKDFFTKDRVGMKPKTIGFGNDGSCTRGKKDLYKDSKKKFVANDIVRLTVNYDKGLITLDVKGKRSVTATVKGVKGTVYPAISLNGKSSIELDI